LEAIEIAGFGIRQQYRMSVNLPLTPIQSISAQTDLVSVEGVAPSWLKIHNFTIWF
jgi:hypothetical protein